MFSVLITCFLANILLAILMAIDIWFYMIKFPFVPSLILNIIYIGVMAFAIKKLDFTG